LISEWLTSLDDHADRGQDNLNFRQYSMVLFNEGIIRVDDLVDLNTAERVQAVIGSNWGTANRLLKFAKEDVAGPTKRSTKKVRR